MPQLARDRGIPVADRAVTNADNPFALPDGYVWQGWTTRATGALERNGGPLVMRVEPAKHGYVWSLLCHSWVEPVLVQLDTGTARNLYIAKHQAFWSAYSRLMQWCRALTDDGMLG